MKLATIVAVGMACTVIFIASIFSGEGILREDFAGAVFMVAVPFPIVVGIAGALVWAPRRMKGP